MKVSVIIATFNVQRTIYKCIKSILDQNYPILEILILDGGSTDNTFEILWSFKSPKIKIIKAGFRDNMEARRSVGFKKAKGEFILSLDSDNYLYGHDDIAKMVLPMEKDKNLAGSFSLHYFYDQQLPTFTRYISLFGNHDPVAYYLGKADRQKFTVNKWPNKSQIVRENQNWTTVKFGKTDFPTLGCNGFLMRKKFFKLDKVKPEAFFHTDVLFDLLADGRNSYAVVDAHIVHDSSPDIRRHLEKRYEYMSLHHISLNQIRRYKVFDGNSKRDWLNLGKFILFTLTFVEPLFESIVGFIKVRDVAWFIHPFLCWAFLLTYAKAIINK